VQAGGLIARPSVLAVLSTQCRSQVQGLSIQGAWRGHGSVCVWWCVGVYTYMPWG
jgi:hypothetical protein